MKWEEAKEDKEEEEEGKMRKRKRKKMKKERVTASVRYSVHTLRPFVRLFTRLLVSSSIQELNTTLSRKLRSSGHRLS